MPQPISKSPLTVYPLPLWKQSPFWDCVLVALLLGWAFFSFTSPIDTKSNDFWWHLSLGRTMVNDHLIPTVDLWSHTQAGKPFVNFEWLFEVVLYAGWSLVKIPGLVVMKGLFLTVQIALLLALLRRKGASVLVAVALSAVWVYFLRYRDYFRPEMITQTGMILTLLWIDRLEKQESGGYGWTALLFALWANFHGGYLLGLALLGIRALTAWPKPVFFLKHTAVALAACLLNPYGWKMIAFPFEHMAILQPHRGQPWEVSEWKPPTWDSHEAFWVWAMIVVAGLLWAQWKEKKWNLSAWLTFGIFGFSATQYARNIHPFILVSLPLLARGAWAARGALSAPRALWARGAMGVGLGIFLGYQTVDAARYSFGTGVVNADYPVQASQFIRERGFQGQLYNSYSWGGYIGWILGREHPVFMDSRFLFVDLLREDTLARKTTEDWQAYLKRYGVDTALVSYPKGFVPASRKRLSKHPELAFKSEWMTLFPPNLWALVFWDSTALVFARRGGVDAALIPAMEYRYFRPDAYLDVEVALRQGALKISDVQADIQRGARESEWNPAARFFSRFFNPQQKLNE